MSTIVLELPDDLAVRLRPMAQDKQAGVVRRGLRKFSYAQSNGLTGVADILERLAALPSPEEVMTFRASPKMQTRIEELLDKNREAGLSSEEQEEWDEYEYFEHMVRMAKLNAALKLQSASA